MAGPSPSGASVVTTSRRPRRAAVTLTAALATAAGCSFVPRTKLDECHRVTQTLRAENGRLKDVALDLRAQNHDLSQRAVDDARRLSAQQEALEALEKSVADYQAERNKLAGAFEALKRQVRLSAGPQPQPSAALGDRLRDFAGSRRGEGWAFDPQTGTLSAPADRLFEPGTARLKPGALDELNALAAALTNEPVPDGEALEVVGRAGSPPSDVRRAGYEVETPGPEGKVITGRSSPSGAGAEASARFLGAARAARVQAALIEAKALEAGRVRLAPATGADAPAPGVGGRVELRAVPHTAALDSRPAAGG
jgi:chemotaxis protein MotB